MNQDARNEQARRMAEAALRDCVWVPTLDKGMLMRVGDAEAAIAEALVKLGEQTERELTRLKMLADTDKASADHWRGVAEKQADVLRMAREALEQIAGAMPFPVGTAAISAINQQLGEN